MNFKIEHTDADLARFELARVVTPEDYVRHALETAHQLRLTAGVMITDAQTTFKRAVAFADELERSARLTADAMRAVNKETARMRSFLENKGASNVAGEAAPAGSQSREGSRNRGTDQSTASQARSEPKRIGNTAGSDVPANSTV